MKVYISLVLGLLVSGLSAQKTPQTIYCNEYHNVALVMNAPIAQAVTGSENFIFTYNQAAVDSLGLLQGRPGPDSNLLIRTVDGGLYSYLLKHSDSISEFIYFIKAEARINQKLKIIESKIKRNNLNLKKDSLDKPVDYYQKLSRYYLNRPAASVAEKTKGKIKLEVQGLYYYRDEVFMVIGIRNRSGIDFKINSLELTKIHGSKGRKSSFQKIPLAIKYSLEFPRLVSGKSEARFIMVYPKYTLGDNEKLKLVLSEKRGSRYVGLKISSREIKNRH